MTAHLDTFARDHLPPASAQPEFLFELPELQFPARLNCATELLDRRVAEGQGDRLCISAPGGLRWTYADLQARANRIANVLVCEMGLVPGNRVLLSAPNNPMLAACWFAVMKAGGIAVATMPLLRAKELGEIIATAQPVVALCDAKLLDELVLAQQQHPVLHTVVPFNLMTEPGSLAVRAAQKDGRFSACPTAGHDIALLAFTSGTTGNPKAALYSHRSTILHTLVGCLGDCWALRSSDVVLPVTPMFHANSWGMPYGAVMTGCKLVFPGPHLHPDDLLDLMRDEPPTLSLGVPTIWMSLIQTYEASLQTQPGRWKLPAGMRSLVGGAAVPEALIRAFDKHGIWILQGWGMTETSPLATVSYPKSEFKDASMDERYRRAAMAGVPVPLVDIRLRGEDGQDAPWDGQHVGEIQVHGPFITGSYHQVPVSEDKFSPDGWLRTGDVASMDTHGFVRITDRTKDLIKSGGEWISSVDLENALMGHPDVAEAAVIAIPDAKWSECPLACVVCKPGKTLNVAGLNAHLLAQGFAKWQLPERYEAIPAVPRTSTGKFYKLKLREMFPT